MKTFTTLNPNPMKTIARLTIAILLSGSVNYIDAEIIKVPADFQTIALAVANAQAGDTIILSPGTYSENDMTISKPLTVSSEWILTGDEAKIESTIINASYTKLFSVKSDDVEISGLRIINGDHTLDIRGRVSIKHNHMVDNLDAISMESGGGGYIGYNQIENDKDDGIDLDISEKLDSPGSDIIVEHNTIVNSNDDGIEIRLFEHPNQNIHYEIRYNRISGSDNAGIQLISYDVYTGKEFKIHHNILQNCKTGLGCMDGHQSSEDLSGALFMDENVYFYNNTILDNLMGATGGKNVIAINNIVSGNTIGGFKLFGENSAIVNNIFYKNRYNNNLIQINSSAEQSNNLFEVNPVLDEVSHRPASSGPCIDAGLDTFLVDGISVIEIAPEEYTGSAPEIGALETLGVSGTVSLSYGSDNCIIGNYPNPFSLSTTIAIKLMQSDLVTVEIFDSRGCRIHTLKESPMDKGMHTIEWSARDDNGYKLPGGIYIARIHTSNFINTTKMLLMP